MNASSTKKAPRPKPLTPRLLNSRRKVVGPRGGAPKAPSQKCSAEGCGKPTREGKPFCTLHVDQHVYVAEVLARIAAREEEVRRANSRGRAKVDGYLAEDLLLQLRINGDRTIRRLCRDLQLTPRAVGAVVRVLVGAGLVKRGRTSRNDVVVILVEQESEEEGAE